MSEDAAQLVYGSCLYENVRDLSENEEGEEANLLETLEELAESYERAEDDNGYGFHFIYDGSGDPLYYFGTCLVEINNGFSESIDFMKIISSEEKNTIEIEFKTFLEKNIPEKYHNLFTSVGFYMVAYAT